ncbi:MAG: hypothetical protein GWO24_13860, partial [Akkermansiaceae bacterium]|nr:hypothetical protein [Akkermansiaceae bacterium]
LTSILAFILLATTASAGSPKIGCAAEVGAPAGPSRNWVLVMLKFIDEAQPHDAYRVYWKAGNANSANSYTLLTTLRPTVSPVSLQHLIDRAGQAGVDLAAFEARLDGILNGVDPGPTLADKLSFLLQAQSELLEYQLDVLANSHPVVAAALGRAHFAAV